MSQTFKRETDIDLGEQVARLEERVAHLEELVRRQMASAENAAVAPAGAPRPNLTTTVNEESDEPGRSAEDLEYEVGQNWFAKVGIVALAVGAAFALSLPFDNVPPIVPSLVGCVVVAILFLLSHLWRDSFDLVSRYFRGAAMALLYMATLRLYFFGASPLLTVDSPLGRALLASIVAVNLAISYRRGSPQLLALSLAMGYATAIAVNGQWFVAISLIALSAIAVHGQVKFNAPAVLIFATVLTYLTYFNRAANNPFFTHDYHLLSDGQPTILILLVCTVILALGCVLRKDREREDPAVIVSSALNCLLGYGVFLLHSVALPGHFPLAHVVASVTLISLAAVFWTRDRSECSTFLYAMTGYMALSVAIVRLSSAPEVFVWLSLQSLVVVTTAIWFQSRFIILANFMIYVGIVAAYVAVARRETGISLVLGVVALISARILSWKKERLLLKTELMRNAYLFTAFVIFPYATFHLVPGAYVALAWVGVALFYYAMNLIVRSPKYRWLGHATLMLTAMYLFIAGISRFEPFYRIISFLVVGAVLLIVSVIFTKVQKRERGGRGSTHQ